MSKVTSPFLGRNDSFTPEERKYDKNIDRTYLKEVVIKTGEADDEFFIDKKMTVYETVDRQKFLDAQAGDVGVLNIIRKAALAGENAADGRFGSSQGFVDADMLPQTLEETINLANEKQRIWENLDPALKANMSFEEFCQAINEEKLADYLKNKVQGSQQVVESNSTENGGND